MKQIIFFLLLSSISVHLKGQFQVKPLTDGAILASGVATALTVYVLVDGNAPLSLNDINMTDPQSVNGFDRSATRQSAANLESFADYAMIAAFGGGIPLLFSETARQKGWAISVMAAQTVIWAATLPQITKIAFPRERPFVYNPGFSVDNKMEQRARESFFSRTTTMAFAGAVFSAQLYDTFFPESVYRYWVWGGSLALAASAGYFKYSSGQHFPTDILMGAAVGSFIGWVIPHIHKNEPKKQHLSSGFAILPGKGACFNISCQF